MKGDRVEVLVDVGTGVQAFELVASKAGRRIEISTGRGMVEVSEVTRSGQPVRSARFMASRVVAMVEHPNEDGDDDSVPRSRARRSTADDQPSLGLEG